MTYGVFESRQVVADNPKCEEILTSLNQQPRPLIIQEAIYSKEELQQAEWYEMYATRQVVDTRDWDYTYEFLCPYQHGEDIRYKHMIQIRPFILQGMPKWKPGMQKGQVVRVKFTVPVSFKLQ